MNFLAHARLSGDNEMVLTGNMVADHIKGHVLDSLPYEMRIGVILHREIDAFTDKHPKVREVVRMLSPEFSRYASVVVDIYFDHFLAIKWDRLGKRDLTDFTRHVYLILLRNYNLLPARSRRILPWMVAQNWLAGYANLRDLQRVFNGMNRRARFENGMDLAVEVLIDNYVLLERVFCDFWPELSSHVAKIGYLDRV